MTNEKLIKLLQEIYPNEKIHISRLTCDPMSFSQKLIARIGQLGYLKFDIESFIDRFNSGDISYEQMKEAAQNFTPYQVEKPSTMWQAFDPLTKEEQESIQKHDRFAAIRWFYKDDVEQMGYEVAPYPVIQIDGKTFEASTFNFETLKEFHQFMDGVKIKKVYRFFQNSDRTYTIDIFVNDAIAKPDVEKFENKVETLQDEILNNIAQKSEDVPVDVPFLKHFQNIEKF